MLVHSATEHVAQAVALFLRLHSRPSTSLLLRLNLFLDSRRIDQARRADRYGNGVDRLPGRRSDGRVQIFKVAARTRRGTRFVAGTRLAVKDFAEGGRESGKRRVILFRLQGIAGQQFVTCGGTGRYRGERQPDHLGQQAGLWGVHEGFLLATILRHFAKSSLNRLFMLRSALEAYKEELRFCGAPLLSAVTDLLEEIERC